MHKKVRDRFIILSGVFILFGALMVTQLFNLQIVNGQVNYEKSQSRLLSDRRIAAPRGNIVDRYGVPLATSRQGFTVQITNTGLKSEQLNNLLINLVNLLEKNGDEYLNNLSRYLTIDNGNIVYGASIAKVGEEDEGISAEEKNAKKIEKIKKDIGITYKDFNATNPEEVFEYFKSKRMFNISDKYSKEEAYKIMCLRFELLIKGFTAINPVTLATDISDQVVAVIDERHDDFPGVTSEVMYVRTYNNAQIASHVIGYLRTMDADAYKSLKDKGYRMDDQIGKAGVEASAEGQLKGKDGLKSVEMDITGRTTKELSERPPVPGNNVVLTIDSKLQKVAMDSLERNINDIRTKGGSKNYGDAYSGAAVAIDVKNGEVLAMASYPSYDPSVFLEGADNKEAQKLISQWMRDEKLKPMVNKTIQERFAPGSTYKPITAIAGLEEGLINRYSKIVDTGRTNIGGMDFVCMEYRDFGIVHGALSVSQALANSCNIFFHELGSKTGIDNIDKWAKAFGLGEKTGIDIDSGLEVRGIRANRPFKKEWAEALNKPTLEKAKKEGKVLRQDELPAYGEWTPADTAQSSIGQLFNAFTPLQLANYISTVANGGKKFNPHVIKKVVDFEGNVVEETKADFAQVPVHQETIDAVKEGMIAVTNSQDGTAVGLFNDLTYNGRKIQVAGKTGTAETGIANASSNALFVCYAPADDPQIAVAVVVEKGVWGSYTAPIARDILQEYFNLNSTSVVDDKVKPEEATITR